MVYLLLLVSIHHFGFFFLELGSFSAVGLTLLKVLASTLFTGVSMLILQLLFFPARRRR
jgi:hypothetical protein